MALIKCPECGRDISDLARSCPLCGYPMENCADIYLKNAQKSNNLRNKAVLVGIVFVVILVIVIVSVIVSNEDDNGKSYYQSSYETHTGTANRYSLNKTGSDASSIFSNLEIYDFSCSPGKYSGRMSCTVKNNNTFTVRGYFRVNFYDKGGKLIYNQLMSLPDVASGETVVCSKPIPEADYPTNYSKVDFSQASLVEGN